MSFAIDTDISVAPNIIPRKYSISTVVLSILEKGMMAAKKTTINPIVAIISQALFTLWVVLVRRNHLRF